MAEPHKAPEKSESASRLGVAGRAACSSAPRRCRITEYRCNREIANSRKLLLRSRGSAMLLPGSFRAGCKWRTRGWKFRNFAFHGESMAERPERRRPSYQQPGEQSWPGTRCGTGMFIAVSHRRRRKSLPRLKRPTIFISADGKITRASPRSFFTVSPPRLFYLRGGQRESRRRIPRQRGAFGGKKLVIVFAPALRKGLFIRENETRILRWRVSFGLLL